MVNPSMSVWKNSTVKENEPRFAICNVCKTEISRGGAAIKTFNTTNLIRLLRTHHSAEYAAFEASTQAKAKAKASGSTEVGSGPMLAAMSSAKNTATTGKIMEFMAMDDSCSTKF